MNRFRISESESWKELENNGKLNEAIKKTDPSFWLTHFITGTEFS